MKVTNWYKKLAASIVAAGIWVPGLAQAYDIPLGDPSFEDYVVPARNYAYAKNPLGEYRPTSAWIDDQDMNDPLPNPPGYIEDDNNSNWLYNTQYAQDFLRGVPRDGNQAMHGHHNYSSQETSAVFLAGRTYTFTIWAQNDNNLNDQNGAFLYIFDGSQPFSDGNALAASGAITAINKREDGMTEQESRDNWTKLSISHFVALNAPEIGNPVGVGFFARRDTAFDDASLSVVPEPSTMFLVGMGGLTLLGFRRKR